ncbi:hypothetical protein MMYC01_203575 [Madurella mycetomatis]|uniref:Ring-like domain-containing protein n=1 Tax=Madurella mycetomatis TaxID=100816 RepID=A0A175W9H3_9PEZI|nr:hypothetical protein MMYC01_203575 [Madurella mycetomatis]
MALHFFKKNKDATKTEGKGTEEAAKAKKDEKSQPTTNADRSTPSAAHGEASPVTPLLDEEDEQFLEHLVSHTSDDEDGGTRPPLPPRRLKTPDLTWDSDSDSFRAADAPETATAPAGTTAAPKKHSRLSRLFQRSKTGHSKSLTVPPTATATAEEEADREWADLSRVLSHLEVTPATSSDPSSTKAQSKTRALALSASDEVKSLVAQFVLILKDIISGAPTAVDDLTALLDGRNDALKRGFEKLPSSLQKLVTQLPKKLTSSLGPEVLAAAAEAQGLNRDKDGGFSNFFKPKNLSELVMTPAIVKSMLKAIVNALKVRWPAFVGTNVLWSAAVFLLLFVLWYCHKRGREEREKREKGEAEGEGEEDETAEEVVSSAVVVVEPQAEGASRA